MSRSHSERLKRIQEDLGVEADGVLGADTLTALERKLRISASPMAVIDAEGFSGLTLTRSGIQQIIDFEIGSMDYYNASLKKPTWPGGDSGVTIGIGYDLGYQTVQGFYQDWGQQLDERVLVKLGGACGKKKRSAKLFVARVSHISIPYPAAYDVFVKTSIPAYSKKTIATFPEIEHLTPNTQTALLSLVYNRGSSVRGRRRSEMLAIQQLVIEKNYEGIAAQIESMKRLWRNRGLDGLLRRRDAEAEMVRRDLGQYPESELVWV